MFGRSATKHFPLALPTRRFFRCSIWSDNVAKEKVCICGRFGHGASNFVATTKKELILLIITLVYAYGAFLVPGSTFWLTNGAQGS